MGDPHDGEEAGRSRRRRRASRPSCGVCACRLGCRVRRLAQELHRAHSGIAEYESAQRLPRVEVVEQYEDFFGLPRGTLVAQRERARAAQAESRMTRASSPQAAREEGVAIAREMLGALRDRVQGAQISAPQGRYASAVDVLEALGSKRPASV